MTLPSKERRNKRRVLLASKLLTARLMGVPRDYLHIYTVKTPGKHVLGAV